MVRCVADHEGIAMRGRHYTRFSAVKYQDGAEVAISRRRTSSGTSRSRWREGRVGRQPSLRVDTAIVLHLFSVHVVGRDPLRVESEPALERVP